MARRCKIMATVVTNKSPLHITCTVGQPYGNVSSGYTCGFHTGTDFPASGTSQKNPALFACCVGVVTYVYKNATGSSPSLGNQVQIKDDATGLYYRYCHMQFGSVHLNVGDRVNTATQVRNNGNNRKFNRSTFTFRMLNFSKLAMFYFRKSSRTFGYSKRAWNNC